MESFNLPTPRQGPEKAWEILHYFLRHPQAADTLEGIVRWRLLEEAIHRDIEETAQALEWLVSEGYLKEISTPHSNRIYCLNHEEVTRAERFLSHGTGSVSK
jgi:hypothetical protein